MFKWIIIATVLTGQGEPMGLLQADSQKFFMTEKACAENMDTEMNIMYNYFKEEDKQIDFNHGACYFIPALKKPGANS